MSPSAPPSHPPPETSAPNTSPLTTTVPNTSTLSTTSPPQHPGLNMANTTSRTHLPVTEAYTRWATVYDRDDNPLQATDSIAMRELVPEFLKFVGESDPLTALSSPNSTDSRPFLIDLGCGTGRNTLPLLTLALSEPPHSLFDRGLRLLALDITPAMLAVAEERCKAALAGASEARRAVVSVEFRCFDILKDGAVELGLGFDGHNANASAHADADADANAKDPRAHGILSSLVAEHVPLSAFFASAASLVRPGGVLLATNMHPDMGSRSGAGFTDEGTGEKVRVHGFNHSVEGFGDVAGEEGWKLLVGEAEGDEYPTRVREIAITEEMVQGEETLRRRGAKWVGVKMWMGGIWRRRTGAGAGSG